VDNADYIIPSFALLNHKCQKYNIFDHKDGYCASSQKIKSKINDIIKNQNKMIKVNQVASNVSANL